MKTLFVCLDRIQTVRLPTEMIALTVYFAVYQPVTDTNIRKLVWKWNHGFYRKKDLQLYGTIEKWDVSNVTDMSGLFFRAKTFNEDISLWDVSRVLTMDRMFYDAISFNQPLSNWKVRRVTGMQFLFKGAKAWRLGTFVK